MAMLRTSGSDAARTEVLDLPTPRHPIRPHAAIIAAAAALWIVSLPFIDLDALTDVGLISVLPPTFFAALALLTAGFAWALTAPFRRGVLPAYVLALVVGLHAVVPVLYDVPKYSYVYKHIAVIEFIAQAGTTYRNIDIYNNWPGFFAANASLSTALGVDPSTYANLALPFFMVLHVLAVRFVARGLTSDARRVAVTMWVFVLGAWLAPTYLAPQSLAYVMALTVFGIVLRSLPGRRSLYVPDSSLGGAPDGFSRPAAVAVVLAMAGAIVVSHQLTPFFLVIGLLVLRRAGLGGSWWLPALVTLGTAVQVAVSYRYVADHQTLFSFDVFQNVQGAQDEVPTPGSAGHQLVAMVARSLSGLLLLLALLGWWRVGRKLGETWVLVLALAPAGLLLVQGYGGEGIYRIYVFMSCWLAFLASGLLARVPRGRGRAAWSRYALAAGSFVAVIALVVSGFGLDRSDHIRPQEVAASRWFEAATPAGSIITFLSNAYPSPATERYSQHFTGDGRWGGEVLADRRFAGRELTAQDIPAVADSLLGIADPGQPVYLAIGPSQEAFASGYGQAPPGAVLRFGELLATDSRFRVVFRDQDAYILQVLRPGESRPGESR
jgi:hypothetical protein